MSADPPGLYLHYSYEIVKPHETRHGRVLKKLLGAAQLVEFLSRFSEERVKYLPLRGGGDAIAGDFVLETGYHWAFLDRPRSI